jgi:hypothetical protein
MIVESNGALLNERLESVDRFNIVPTARRPASAKTRSQYEKRERFVAAEEPCEKLYLSEVVQQTRAYICDKCGESILKLQNDDVNYSYCLSCEMEEQDLQDKFENSIDNENIVQTGETPNKYDDVTSCDLILIDNEDEIKMMNMHEIEASLVQVRQEIRACLESEGQYEDNSAAILNDDSAENNTRQSSQYGFMERILNLDDNKLKHKPKENEKSKPNKLHQQDGRNITVYQFSEEENDRSRKTVTRVGDNRENRVSGSITTYDMNVIKPGMLPVYMDLYDTYV